MSLFNKHTYIQFGKLSRNSENELKYAICKGPYNKNIVSIVKGIIKGDLKKYDYKNSYAVILYRPAGRKDEITVVTPEEFLYSEDPEE